MFFTIDRNESALIPQLDIPFKLPKMKNKVNQTKYDNYLILNPIRQLYRYIRKLW